MLTESGAAPISPDDLIRRLLARVTADIREWDALAGECDILVWVAVHFGGFNPAFALSSEVVAALAARHATVLLDLYADGDK